MAEVQGNKKRDYGQPNTVRSYTVIKHIALGEWTDSQGAVVKGLIAHIGRSESGEPVSIYIMTPEALATAARPPQHVEAYGASIEVGSGSGADLDLPEG